MPLDLKALIDGCNGKIALCDLREKAALLKSKGHEKSIWFRASAVLDAQEPFRK